jgi:hypothetical protein
VLVGVALVTGKSFPVQASLWLLPLLALCGLRWRDHLVWAGAEAMHFAMVWLYIGGMSKADRGLPAPWYAVFLALRVAAVLYLVWRVWHDAARRPPTSPGLAAGPEVPAKAELMPVPEDEATLGDELDGELAGAFAGAPDRLLVRIG